MSASGLLRDVPAQARTWPGGQLSRRVGPELLAIAAVTVLAGVLRFAGIGQQGFWSDEGHTVLLVHSSLGKMFGLIPQTESTPPLYYCVAWVWARVVGVSEAPLRSLSALAGVTVVPVVYATGATLSSRRVGLIAAALTACNPLLVWYSQEARAYELLVLLTSLSLLAAAHLHAKPTRRAAAAWVIAASLALATHYYAALAVVPQAVWLLARHRRERSLQVAVGVVVACGLALLPLALSQRGNGGADWIAFAPLSARLEQIVPQFLIGFQAPVQGLLEAIAGAIAISGLALIAIKPEAAERRVALLAAALAAGGLLLNLLLVAGGVDDLVTRNAIALWLPAALLIAIGLGSRRAGVFGMVATAALCAVGIVAIAGVASNRDFQRPDWRPVARVLGTHPASSSSTRAIVVLDYGELLPLSLYLPRMSFWQSGSSSLTEVDVISFQAPRVRYCWWGAACYLPTVLDVPGWKIESPAPVRGSYQLPGFHEYRRRVLQFTVVRLVSSRPVSLTPRQLAGALQTTESSDGFFIQR